MLTSATGASSVLPPEYGQLVEKPAEAMSVAFLAGTRISTAGHSFIVPVLGTDVTATAVAEGATITATDVGFDPVTVVPAKFASLTVVSSEMASDSNPATSEIVGRSAARAISNAVDKAFLTSQSSPNPAGLATLTGISTVDAPAAFTDVDPFEEAVSLSEAAGGRITGWVMNAAAALELRTLKVLASGSNQALLNSDLTADGRSTLLGRPIYISPFCPDGVVYGISQDDALIVTRTDTTLAIDTSAYFASDSVGIRATMRVAFGFPVPAAHVRITQAAGA
ncbi:phage major capsid protein [Streptomyces sp. NBC_00144]|uniref:phage major capsid protein n=1 Tax=Streptomyces sp. NBC_00144 TaxID=2975665 RepID=UPI0032433096